MRLSINLCVTSLCLLLAVACAKRLEPGVSIPAVVPPAPPPPTEEPQDFPIFMAWEEAPGAKLLARRVPPVMLKKVQESGLWDSNRLTPNFSSNPYCVRGDFNGDGENDLAVYVLVGTSQERGLAVIHSTLDTLFIFTEGRPQRFHIGEQMRVLPKGTYIRPFPKSELATPSDYDDTPFILEREAIDVHYIASNSLWYWNGTKYINIPISD